jgi:hypothetical protein
MDWEGTAMITMDASKIAGFMEDVNDTDLGKTSVGTR